MLLIASLTTCFGSISESLPESLNAAGIFFVSPMDFVFLLLTVNSDVFNTFRTVCLALENTAARSSSFIT